MHLPIASGVASTPTSPFTHVHTYNGPIIQHVTCRHGLMQAFDAPCRVSAHVRLRCVRSAPVSLTSTTHRRLINSTIPKTVLCCDPLLSPPSPLFIRSNMPTTTDPEHVQCLFKSKRGIFISHRYRNHFLLIIRYLWSFEKSIQISAIYHSIQ